MQRPTPLDKAFQLAYVFAYRGMRVYWHLMRPNTHGALVALFHEGQLLLVKNSYVDYYSLPGGYVRRKETGRAAAVRELREEVGIIADPQALELVSDATHDWHGKRDHVELFTLELKTRPVVAIDHREVVSADWFSPERALSLNLFPPIRTLLEQRMARVS